MTAVSSDVIVSHVTFSAQELGLRLNQNWEFLTIERGQVFIHEEPIADFEKRGPSVFLTPIGPREAVRWIAWAIQSICPDSEANDEDADPSRITDEPMPADDAEKTASDIVGARLAAIAKEADPAGGAHQAVVLVTYLVKKELLELCGPTAAVARAVFPLLTDVDDTIGSKLEDVLLDLDEVDELFADAEQLTKLIQANDHIFDR
jgi:hypothetical protein